MKFFLEYGCMHRKIEFHLPRYVTVDLKVGTPACLGSTVRNFLLTTYNSCFKGELPDILFCLQASYLGLQSLNLPNYIASQV